MAAGWHLGAAYLAAIALAFVVLFYRCWRTGVRFDQHGIRIRGFLWTDRFKWADVSRFADGRTSITVAETTGDVWVLAVVLNSGEVISVKATAKRGKPECLRLSMRWPRIIRSPDS